MSRLQRLRDVGRPRIRALGAIGAVDHPANGGITGEDYPDPDPESGADATKSDGPE